VQLAEAALFASSVSVTWWFTSAVIVNPARTDTQLGDLDAARDRQQRHAA
jgi:hypothetical protein